MRREVALLLAVLLLSAALSGCTGRPVSGEKPAPTPEETSAPTPEPTPAPTPDCSLSWAKAFRDDSLPEGSVSPEEIAFFATDEEGQPEIVNVRKEEVRNWWDEQESLPRTRYFERLMPETLQELYPILDYAVAHSYSRFCVPTADFTSTDVGDGKKLLMQTFLINNSGISAENCGSFDLGGGRTLQYILLTLNGMNSHGNMSEYQQSIARAREIVAEIPEGSGDYDKILYLYRWLTDHVTYYSGNSANDYYENEWNLLYDTLVRNETVCAGYAEALYVMSNLAGVECINIWGNLNMGGEWSAHIWNAAKIDGVFYLFDATWDAGRQPEYYSFFGVSRETMDSYYRRLVLAPSEENIPPCTEELPLAGHAVFPADLNPGTLTDGIYSQPFAGLLLTVDDSWTAYSREEIVEAFYGGMELSMEKILRLGTPYFDLVLEKYGKTVEVMLECASFTAPDGSLCDSAESYMNAIQQLLPAEMEAAGYQNVQSTRAQKEICGRIYECTSVSSILNGMDLTQTFLCTERDGYFLTIVLASSVGGQWERTLQELTANDMGG